MSICLKEFGVVCALGQSKQQVFERLLSGNDGLTLNNDLPLEDPQYVGSVEIISNETIKNISTRNNQLAYLAYCQIEESLKPLIEQFGHHRVAVIIGTSTSGIFESGLARKKMAENNSFPKDFHYQMQELVAPANFIADLCQATGPVYAVSTACSSSGKVLVSAKALLESDLADVVIEGGVDSLAQFTVNGFNSLESIANNKCQPFSKNRDGINIGEAAALFLVCKSDVGIQLLGTGETSDAYHISAPAPDGQGAYLAMKQALDSAGINGNQVDYVNLHGTGTIKNDEMESIAMNHACGKHVLCSSTKHLTGHTLGAAGALEIGICWLLLSDFNKHNFIPANTADGEIDPTLAKINLCKGSKGQFVERINFCMSNSFAFGGNNFSSVLGKTHE